MAQPFRFLDLPTDIRFIVYEFLVGVRHCEVKFSTQVCQRPTLPYLRKHMNSYVTLVMKSMDSNIISTCKLIRDEALRSTNPSMKTVPRMIVYAGDIEDLFTCRKILEVVLFSVHAVNISALPRSTFNSDNLLAIIRLQDPNAQLSRIDLGALVHFIRSPRAMHQLPTNQSVEIAIQTEPVDWRLERIMDWEYFLCRLVDQVHVHHHFHNAHVAFFYHLSGDRYPISQMTRLYGYAFHDYLDADKVRNCGQLDEEAWMEDWEEDRKGHREENRKEHRD